MRETSIGEARRKNAAAARLHVVDEVGIVGAQQEAEGPRQLAGAPLDGGNALGVARDGSCARLRRRARPASVSGTAGSMRPAKRGLESLERAEQRQAVLGDSAIASAV